MTDDSHLVVYLRVKRPRTILTVDSEALSEEPVRQKLCIRCPTEIDSILQRLQATTASNVQSDKKPIGIKRVFTSIATSLDELPACDNKPTALLQNRKRTAITPQSSSLPVLSDDAYDAIYKGPQRPNEYSVKKAYANAVAETAKERRRAAAVQARGSLRCERMGIVRDRNSIHIIDASWIAAIDEDNGLVRSSAVSENLWNDGAVYDLYALDDGAAEDTSSSDGEEASASADAFATVFDDANDEFSFDIQITKKRKSNRQRTRLWEMELQAAEAPDRWVVFTDSTGMAVCDVVQADGSVFVPLVPDDPREGFDNYMYYDHRGDDEYDSNAEDHVANDYPEDDDSEEEADHCGWQRRRGHSSGSGSDGDDCYYDDGNSGSDEGGYD